MSEGLIDERDRKALTALLRAGRSHFAGRPRTELSTYVYLTSTSEGSTEQVRPSREDRSALLSNDRGQIQAQVDRILSRSQDETARRQITQAYVQRLKGVVNDASDRYTADERKSANIALVLIEITLAGDELAAYQSAIERDPKDAASHYSLGNLYFELGRYEQARAAYQRAIDLEPTVASYRESLQRIVDRERKKALADEALTQATGRSSSRRPLTTIELAEARLVFGDGLDYSHVFVLENTLLPNWIADIGRSPKPNAVTLGNVSYFPETLETSAEAIASGNLRTMAWLIHELTHQWQFQHMGWAYLLRAVLAQLREGPSSYKYRLESGRRLADFNMEQQGDIARDYYVALKQGRDVSVWEPFVAEFRQTAPLA